jgi:hypothetical protein
MLPLVAKAHGTTEKDLVQAGTAEKMINCQIHVDVLGTGVRVLCLGRTLLLGGVELFNRITAIGCTRVLFGLKRPIGQSLTRAFRHLITSTPVSWSGTWMSGSRLDHDPRTMRGILFILFARRCRRKPRSRRIDDQPAACGISGERDK